MGGQASDCSLWPSGRARWKRDSTQLDARGGRGAEGKVQRNEIVSMLTHPQLSSTKVYSSFITHLAAMLGRIGPRKCIFFIYPTWHEYTYIFLLGHE